MQEITLSAEAFKEVKDGLADLGLDNAILGPRITLGSIELREGPTNYTRQTSDAGLLDDPRNSQ